MRLIIVIYYVTLLQMIRAFARFRILHLERGPGANLHIHIDSTLPHHSYVTCGKLRCLNVFKDLVCQAHVALAVCLMAIISPRQLRKLLRGIGMMTVWFTDVSNV
ncbi:hypothetical protein J6590_016580 [Homalodisca vitripennis]|nr:hypothetical protein J6590_016580 [Homalodisca vitripennis]